MALAARRSGSARVPAPARSRKASARALSAPTVMAISQRENAAPGAMVEVVESDDSTPPQVGVGGWARR